MMPLRTQQLGSAGPAVSTIALGCMGMSGMYGPSDEDESIATIHAALDAGINLLDTGDFYGMGHNEMLVGRAVADRKRDDFLISVKFGAQRGPDGAWLGYDARPAAVKTALAYSLQRLKNDYIDIYRPARLDARSHRFPQPRAALPGTEPRAEPCARGRAAIHRRAGASVRRAGRDRLGAVARQGQRAADRRPYARAAAGGPRGARARAQR